MSGFEYHTTIREETGREHLNTGAEGEGRETLDGLKQHRGELNAAPLQGLQRTLPDSHEEVLLMLPEKQLGKEASKWNSKQTWNSKPNFIAWN